MAGTGSLKIVNGEEVICPFHADIARRIESLEGWRTDVDRERVQDFRALSDKLGEVHEKINSVALKVEGLVGSQRGKSDGRSALIAILGLAVAAAALYLKRGP